MRITRLNSLLESVNLTDDQRARVEARLSNVENVASKLRNIESRIRERRTNNSEAEDSPDSETANNTEVETKQREILIEKCGKRKACNKTHQTNEVSFRATI